MFPGRASPIPKALAIVLLMLSVPSRAPASPESSSAAPQRDMFRISVSPGTDLRPLLGLGLDVAGRGPGGSLDVILDARELAMVRALGFSPAPVDLAPHGALGAAQSPLFKPSLGDYHTNAEAHDEMAAYVASHPTIALLDTIGFSIEGRAIEAVKVSDNVAAQEAEAEALIVGCHHAREIMSVELPLYLMRRLLDGYGTDPLIASLVDGLQIWIVPILNPDGHLYVEEHTSGQSGSWWRKNRRANGDGTFGVDLNRNYGYLWGYDNFGSSPTTSSEVYRGTGPFSEPEAAAFRDFIAGHQFRVSASFHSYGELVLYPWGYGLLDTPDHSIFQALGDSIAAQNGYLAGNPKSGAIYITNGDMDDWVYGDGATKPSFFGFTFEVNTAGDGGFDPPDGMIAPTCDLNWGALLTILRYADAPRRVLPPARPSRPFALFDASAGYRLHWSYPSGDPDNPPARHDVKQIASFAIVTDDAESGVADWDSTRFEWSSARSASAAHSYWSGSDDNRTSELTARVLVEPGSGDSVVVRAFWDVEPLFDFWYAEASADFGTTWTPLAGDHTTSENPHGTNQGEGVTGTSGGVFDRAAFSLQPFAGQEVLLRFRCVTDAVTHGEGLYLDDIAPVAREAGVTIFDTASPDSVYALPSPPVGVAYFQTRGVDAETQRGPWSARGRVEPGVTAVSTSGAPAPAMDRLGPSSPNPFNPAMTVRFTLGRGAAGAYRLDVHDVAGRRVARLAEGWDAGLGTARLARWDGLGGAGSPLPSGVYLLRLETVRGVETGKVTLLR